MHGGRVTESDDEWVSLWVSICMGQMIYIGALPIKHARTDTAGNCPMLFSYLIISRYQVNFVKWFFSEEVSMVNNSDIATKPLPLCPPSSVLSIE